MGKYIYNGKITVYLWVKYIYNGKIIVYLWVSISTMLRKLFTYG